MSDFEIIHTLFNPKQSLPQFVEKNNIRVYPSYHQHGPTKSTQYNCKNESDKLILYHEAYLELDVEINYGKFAAANDMTDLPNKKAIFKNTTEMIKHSIVRLNNKEIDNSDHQMVYMEMLNTLEYNHSSAQIELEKYGWIHDSIIPDGAADGWKDNKYDQGVASLQRFNFYNTSIPTFVNADTDVITRHKVNIPLKFVSTFFRALDFPIIHNNFEIEVTFDPKSTLLLHADVPNRNKITANITDSVLVLPHIKLNTEDTSRFLNSLASDRTLVWHKPEIYTYPHLKYNHKFNQLIVPSLNGVKRMYVAFVHNDYLAAENHHLRATSDCKITNTNIEIDSQLMYKLDLTSDIEHYNMTQECMNMQGKDPNSGVLLNYMNWANVHRFYCFSLERQVVLESDPRKSQAIRFKTTLNGTDRGTGTGDYTGVFVLLTEKVTTLNFSNPTITNTI